MQPVVIVICLALALCAAAAAAVVRHGAARYTRTGSWRPLLPPEWRSPAVSWAAASIVLVAVASTMKGAMLMFEDESLGANVGFFASTVVLFVVLRLVGRFPG